MSASCRQLLLVLILLLPVNAASAVTDSVHYEREHYTDENGLPQNSVKYIAPDNAGFIWLATENGLVRCDGGDRFRIFNRNELNISSSRLSYVYASPDHLELLASTEHNEFLSITRGKVCVEDGRPATRNMLNYLRFDSGPRGTYSLMGLPNVHENEISARNYLFPVDKRSYFLVGGDSVTLMKDRQPHFSVHFNYVSPWKFFIVDGLLHYLDNDGGVTTFDGGRVSTTELTGDILKHPGYPSRKHAIKLYWNFAAGEMFIYLDKTCYLLQRLPDGRLNTLQVLHGFDFGANRIVSVYYDARHARVFLGSLTRGLFIFTRQSFRVLNSGPGFEGDLFYAQAGFGTNKVLTPHGVVFDDAGPVQTLPLLRERSLYGDYYSLVVDRQGNIWYKTSTTLYKFNSTGTALLWSWTAPSRISQLYVGSDNYLWIGTHGNGLYRLSLTLAEPTPELFLDRLREVSCMEQETPEVLWVGAEKGLYRVLLPSRKIDTVQGLSNTYIRSLSVERPGFVWITTYDNGFFLYRNQRLTSFPLDRKKYLATAHCIVEGYQGNCWITTNKGLFQASKSDLLAYADGKQSYVYYQYYGKDKGFNTNEFNGGCQPCAIKWANGNISLPSLDGLVIYSPGDVHAELPDGELFIERAELDGELFPYDEDTLRLPHEFQQLQLHVSVPYFGDPYNLQLSYALTGGGQDTVWLPLTKEHSLSFSTLSSGTYRLHIRKINGFGNNNYTEKILLLTVAPAYYETIWFRLLIVLSLIAAVVVYIRIHTYHIKQQNLSLESRVSARTAELESTMASLRRSEKKLRRQTRTQERLIASITHDIKTPMKFLMTLAGNLSWKQQHELEPELIARSSKAIYDASYRMYYMIDNLIQYIKTHVKNGSARPEEIDLHELMEEKIDIFGSIAQTNNTTIINNVPAELEFSTHYQVLAVVIHNLLDNAVKNTREGEIILSAVASDGKITVSFEDSGTGLPPTLIQWINHYAHPNGKDEGTSPVHNGMGLLIVLELLEQVNGRLTAENKPHRGAIIKIELKAS